MDLKSFLRVITHAPEENEGDLFITSFGEDLPPTARNCALNLDEAVAAVEELGSEPGRNVYWSSWLRRPGIKGRGGEQDLTVGLAIVVDLDQPEAASHYKERILEAPMPLNCTATVRTSGNRFQLVYVLGEPCADIARWREAARRLEAWFGADHCTHDPSHVWRMPFTMNYPNAKKRAAGRVPEMSVLVDMNEARMFDIEDIIEFLPEPPQAVVAASELPPPSLEGLTQVWKDPVEIIARIDSPIQADLLDETWGPNMDRSEFDYRLCKEAVKAGLSWSDVCWLYAMSTDKAFTEKAREKGSGAERYLMTTFSKAQAAVKLDLDKEPKLPAPTPEPEEEEEDEGLISAKEITGHPVKPIEYWIRPWLPKSGITMVHGVAGTGKTYFMLYQLYGLVAGIPIGGFKFHSGEPPVVLYVDFEQSAETVVRRMHQIKRAYGDRGMDRIFILNAAFATHDKARFYADNEEGRARVHRAIAKVKPDIVVLDNARVAMRGMDENSKAGWDMWNNWLMELRDTFGVQPVWLHHDNKPSKSDGYTTYAGSSHAITTVEQEVKLTVPPYSIHERAEIFASGNGNILRNLIEVGYGKVRDSDEPLKGCYLQFLEDETRPGIVTMLRYTSYDDTTDWCRQVIASMDEDQAAWVLCEGKYDGISYSQREVAKMMGVGRTTVQRHIEKVKTDVRRLNETDAFAKRLLDQGGPAYK